MQRNIKDILLSPVPAHFIPQRLCLILVFFLIGFLHIKYLILFSIFMLQIYAVSITIRIVVSWWGIEAKVCIVAPSCAELFTMACVFFFTI